LRKFIPLKELVNKEKLDFTETIENYDFSTEVNIRNVKCRYFTNSKRTLWQAVGIEYIEPEMLDYIDSLGKDKVFYDIGASNGIFSMYALQKDLQVYSFEPEIQNFALLGINSYLNKNVKYEHKLFNIAISDENKLSNMYIAKFEAGGHMKILGKPQKVGDNKDFIPDFVQNVLSYSLDCFIEQFNLEKPESIKIDVDGAELAVINGAKETLKYNKLKSIFIELEENNKNTEEIIQIILDAGFI
jgi:FkbM family methyltransferase